MAQDVLAQMLDRLLRLNDGAGGIAQRTDAFGNVLIQALIADARGDFDDPRIEGSDAPATGFIDINFERGPALPHQSGRSRVRKA